MAEKVNAETDLNPKKSRKARTVKPVKSNYEKTMELAISLTTKEKALLSREMKTQALQEKAMMDENSVEVGDLLQGI